MKLASPLNPNLHSVNSFAENNTCHPRPARTQILLTVALSALLAGTSGCSSSNSSSKTAEKVEDKEQADSGSGTNNVGTSTNSGDQTTINASGPKTQGTSTASGSETGNSETSGENTDTASDIQVRINRAPTLSSMQDQANTVGDEITKLVDASDEDGDALTYSAQGLPEGVSIDADTGMISGDAATAGTYETVISVSDGKLTQDISFIWTVELPPNTPPTVSNPGTQQNTVNEHINLTVLANDDDNQTLVYSAINLPEGVSINQDSGNISGILTTAGNYTASVTVSDGEDTASTEFSWDIEENPWDDLVAWWKFDEASGNTAVDSSGNGNDATIINGGRGDGIINRALEMDGGENSYVRVPQSDSLRNAASQITVMAWAYRTAKHNVAILAHNYPYSMFFGFHEFNDETPARSVFKWDINNVDQDNAACWTGNAELNQWFHITGTYNGSLLRLYVDGQEICHDAMTGPIKMFDFPVTVSGYLRGGDTAEIKDEITGKIDDLRVYNRALTVNEIESIYQEGR